MLGSLFSYVPEPHLSSVGNNLSVTSHCSPIKHDSLYSETIRTRKITSTNVLANMDKEITFDKLPEAVTYLTEQVSAIKEMVSALRPPIPEEKSLIGIDEACEVIQKAEPTIYALVRKGIIPAYKRGKKLYFYKEELLQWVKADVKASLIRPPQRINYPP